MSARDVSFRPPWSDSEIELWTRALNTHASIIDVRLEEVKRLLAAAGYRILGPDELDPVTVERARKSIRNAALHLSPSQRANGDILDDTIATALRSLGDGR